MNQETIDHVRAMIRELLPIDGDGIPEQARITNMAHRRMLLDELGEASVPDGWREESSRLFALRKILDELAGARRRGEMALVLACELELAVLDSLRNHHGSGQDVAVVLADIGPTARVLRDALVRTSTLVTATWKVGDDAVREGPRGDIEIVTIVSIDQAIVVRCGAHDGEQMELYAAYFKLDGGCLAGSSARLHPFTRETLLELARKAQRHLELRRQAEEMVEVRTSERTAAEAKVAKLEAQLSALTTPRRLPGLE